MLSVNEEVGPVSAGPAPGPSTKEECLRGWRNIGGPSEVKVDSHESAP